MLYTKGEHPKVNRHSIAKVRPLQLSLQTFGTCNTSKHSLLTRHSDMNLEQLWEPQKCFWGYVEPLNLWKINGHFWLGAGIFWELFFAYFGIFFLWWINIKIIPPPKIPLLWDDFGGAVMHQKKFRKTILRSAWSACDLGDWRTWQR